MARTRKYSGSMGGMSTSGPPVRARLSRITATITRMSRARAAPHQAERVTSARLIDVAAAAVAHDGAHSERPRAAGYQVQAGVIAGAHAPESGRAVGHRRRADALPVSGPPGVQGVRETQDVPESDVTGAHVGPPAGLVHALQCG